MIQAEHKKGTSCGLLASHGQQRKLKICIGIMLWNEEDSIAMTIDSIFQQTLLKEQRGDIGSIEVIALANGCTDQSVTRAAQAFARNLLECPLPYLSARVDELPKGKLGAWNHYVHEATPSDADYLFFADADVKIHEGAMAALLDGLERNDYYHVASGHGLKDIELDASRTLWERMTLQATNVARGARLSYVCGQCYGGRADFFRKFMFPEGFLCGDDALVMVMAVTNLLTTEYQFDRVYHDPRATFVFEAYTSPRLLFRQHVRRQSGAAIRTMMQDYLRLQRTEEDRDAGATIFRLSRQNPLWLVDHSKEIKKQRGFWVIPCSQCLKKVSQLRAKSLRYRMLNLPLVLASTLWQLAVIVSANRRLRNDSIAELWENNPNRRMITVA